MVPRVARQVSADLNFRPLVDRELAQRLGGLSNAGPLSNLVGVQFSLDYLPHGVLVVSLALGRALITAIFSMVMRPLCPAPTRRAE